MIKKCSHYEVSLIQTALEDAAAALGGWEQYVKSGDKVLLKPNLIAPRRPEEAATTHPEVLRALIRILQARGCQVFVGDSAGGAIGGTAPTAKALMVAGFAQVCDEEGAVLLNFDREGAVPVSSRTKHVGAAFHIARPIVEADVVINVPKLKTHSSAAYTGAVKNTFGCIPGLRKAAYHRDAPDLHVFGEVLADIHLACKVQLNILDGIVGMEGAGPTNGKPRPVGLLLVSDDALALDTVAAQVIGLDPQQLEVLQAAARLGVGEGDPARITLLGDMSTIPHVPFLIPTSYKTIRRAPHWLLPALIDFLRTQPQIDGAICKQCGICRGSCPVDAIDTQFKIDYHKCIDCLCCQELCPHGAVRLVRKNRLARRLIPVKH